MKMEISIEEKARRYDEAYKKVAVRFGSNVADEIFPELKESDDERIRKKLIEAVKGDMVVGGTKDKQLALAWLEKQGEKESVTCPICGWEIEKQGEQKPAWSEEDEKTYQSIMDDTVQENQLNDKQTNWLRDIKYRYFPQQKQEWNEEDEEMLRRCISATFDHGYLKECDWLKSLKDRYTWKPSEEQMADLWNMVCECRPADQQLLQDIYYGLKTLRGE